MKAIFLDRDGTIIIDKHYLHKVDDLEYYPDSFKAMKLLQNKGYQLFIVTNQSGVGRGYFPLKDVHAVHKAMQDDLKKQGLLPYLDIAISPHHPDDHSPYRKPGPMMINDLCKKWNIQKEKSYMLGDKLSDAQAGENANVTGILVRKKELTKHTQFSFFSDLMSFANSVT